jgi:dTMP kinase
MTGKFISFEGGEGAGKSTQIQKLSNYLQEQGIQVIVTREPGGTPGAEALRHLLKDVEDFDWDGLSEILLLYAARRDHVIKLIKPALEKGQWILCDRFSDSTIAYQGYARGLSVQMIQTLHQMVLGDFYPDLTFILDIAPEVGLLRSKARSFEKNDLSAQDRFERMDISFHQKLHHAFLDMAKSDPRFVCIDAGQDLESVFNNIIRAIPKKFANFSSSSF